MKLRTAIIALTACGLSFPTLADVNLELPKSAELVLVNGVDADGNNALTLKDGKNQIAFRIEENYRENGDYNLFKSDIVIMTFDGQDANYVLTLPKITSSLEGEKFNRAPSLKLKNKSDSSVDFEQGKLMKNGVQFGRDLEKEMAVYNQSSQPAAYAMATGAIAVTLPATINPADYPALQNKNGDKATVAGQMLDYWYSQADEATRANFKARIAK
ncbi:DUF2057 domain-containing protein [Photobacterium profundum]|uniref:UPF0319 protein P3TCK_21918 n=2 Tax=Photobacterium profundum TaxID=74109 RepID=Q1YVY6_9GAMM|nr:DUF2057 domain-containing protein [Photobacterium profundum]EAS40438.1 hypothetical protein P3TCK_21918 [Photobacterium profundum 3TCK]PSV60572.1 DUF2057 domain-containing protein [Photobacterium profundum]